MSSLTPLEAASSLRASLDAIATALARGDAAALLAAEEGLAAAVDTLTRVSIVDPTDADAVIREVADARAALGRCTALGTVLAELAAAVQGGQYNQRGSSVFHGRVDVHALETKL